MDRRGYREGAGRLAFFAALVDAGRTMTVTSTMVDAIAATTAGLRNLGDAEGGPT